MSGHFRLTALIGAHDVMAVGEMHAAREQGYRVSEDISVAGLDTIALARFCDPPLTTVHIERYRIATALCGSLFPEVWLQAHLCEIRRHCERFALVLPAHFEMPRAGSLAGIRSGGRSLDVDISADSQARPIRMELASNPAGPLINRFGIV
ncbi:MAG: substrate-binding domain-containing protein [Bryobacteraceae bacterium]